MSVVPVVKPIGKELLVQAVPELKDIATRKKTPKEALKKSKKRNQKKSWSWTQQVPIVQKTEESNINNKKKNQTNTVYFLSCDKHLITGVTIRFSLI